MKIATFPEGSVPHVVLLFWLNEVLKAGTDDVEILGMGTNAVQQAVLSDAVDGASTLQPIVSIVLDKKPDTRVLASGSELFPNQPGAVLAVRQEILDQYPDEVYKLVSLIKRATSFIKENPKEAAAILHKHIGAGLTEIELFEQAVRASGSSFQVDPGQIIESTRIMHDFQVKTGSLATPVDLNTFIDTRYYNGSPEE